MFSLILYIGTTWFVWHYVSKTLQASGINKFFRHFCGALFSLVIAYITFFSNEPQSTVKLEQNSENAIHKATIYAQTSILSLIKENPTQAYLSNNLATPLPQADMEAVEHHISVRSSFSPKQLDKINNTQVISHLAVHHQENKQHSKLQNNAQSQNPPKFTQNRSSLPDSASKNRYYRCDKHGGNQSHHCNHTKQQIPHCTVSNIKSVHKPLCENYCG
ncbi:hypothetical protein [Actinobacillus equuli]|uniref:hypothetical protein n=1 Tax=Actinobacillus equuli TaxID=718 RepID=UPI002441A2DB|nr:hypothetical protein [Actinobacillus equuli]WGE66312.1 hypothetical protein NYR76_04965 [Actinobacillus equuli subsp. equuli]WGE80237.1 hypothetical protein NYR83_04700 [Actinobacillus equuli subsp. equuli]